MSNKMPQKIRVIRRSICNYSSCQKTIDTVKSSQKKVWQKVGLLTYKSLLSKHFKTLLIWLMKKLFKNKYDFKYIIWYVNEPNQWNKICLCNFIYYPVLSWIK